MKNRLYVTLLLLIFCQPLFSQEKSKLAPNFFGPNALPIPDMLDGRVTPGFDFELSGDYNYGFYGDQTYTINARIEIPLFTPRVKLSVWMPVVEFFQNTPESIAHQNSRSGDMSGSQIGDVYISTDIHIVKERRILPDMALRVGIKTASGDGDENARYHDTPGYFFDASFGKSFHIKNSFINEIRTSVSGGFLCWQVDATTQNDAIMYGAKVSVASKYATLNAEWGGYMGWMKNGDSPMSIKTRLDFHIKNWSPFIAYQYGIHDYPFHQIRVGVSYNLIVRKKSK